MKQDVKTEKCVPGQTIPVLNRTGFFHVCLYCPLIYIHQSTCVFFYFILFFFLIVLPLSVCDPVQPLDPFLQSCSLAGRCPSLQLLISPNLCTLFLLSCILFVLDSLSGCQTCLAFQGVCSPSLTCCYLCCQSVYFILPYIGHEWKFWIAPSQNSEPSLKLCCKYAPGLTVVIIHYLQFFQLCLYLLKSNFICNLPTLYVRMLCDPMTKVLLQLRCFSSTL